MPCYAMSMSRPEVQRRSSWLDYIVSLKSWTTMSSAGEILPAFMPGAESVCGLGEYST